MHNSERLAKSTTQLFAALSNPTNIVRISRGCLISINNTPEPDCFLIHTGYTLLRRTEDRLVHGTVGAPVLFGFNIFQNLAGNVFLEAMTDVEFEVIPATLFYQQIEAHNLWKPLLDVLMYISSELFRKNNALAVRDSWSIIRTQLNELINEPTFIRQHTCAYDYIQQRTHLSRSGIMKYLSALRKKGLIDMENGILRAVSLLPVSLE